jgi:RNA polymerase sigma factor (sigma-70 family)
MENSWQQVSVMSVTNFGSFLERYPQYEYAMRKLARGRRLDSLAAQEAYQETIYRILTKLERYAEIRNVWAFGRITLNNVVHEMMRKKLVAGLLDPEPQPFTLTPYDIVENEETRNDLRMAMFLLDARERYMLHPIVYGIPQKEVAESLGVSESNVSRTKHATLQKLADLVGRQREKLRTVVPPKPPVPEANEPDTVVVNGKEIRGRFCGVEPIDVYGGRILDAFQTEAGELLPILRVPKLRPYFSLKSEWVWSNVLASDKDVMDEPDPIILRGLLNCIRNPGCIS